MKKLLFPHHCSNQSRRYRWNRPCFRSRFHFATLIAPLVRSGLPLRAMKNEKCQNIVKSCVGECFSGIVTSSGPIKWQLFGDKNNCFAPNYFPLINELFPITRLARHRHGTDSFCCSLSLSWFLETNGFLSWNLETFHLMQFSRATSRSTRKFNLSRL